LPKIKIAVLVGSIRRESINRKLAQAIAKLGGEQLAFHFVALDDLPLYNQDLKAKCRRGSSNSRRKSPRPMRCCS
jgi:chromate reductase, NAD(P)H dehydrogenase (quinone)